MRELEYDEQSNGRANVRNKGSRLGYFLSALIGVVLGASIVVVVFPGFSNLDTSTDQLDNISKINQNVSLDVTTAVTEAYDTAGDAVVGITNIQEVGFFSQSGEIGRAHV